MRITTLMMLLFCLVSACWSETLTTGSRVPPLPAEQSVRKLSGSSGLVLVVFRSADW